MKIVFMGTPDFAVPCLKRLIEDGHTVSAVFTQPDKPKGRGYVMTPPPVKMAAEAFGIPVFQPKKLRDAENVDLLKQLEPDCIVVVAYGQILPQSILSIPPKGCINVHASLLPKLRGAAPIQWAVINGEHNSGVTTMQMDAGLDTGEMLMKQETEIAPNETAGELHDRLSSIGAEVLSKTMVLIEQDRLNPVPQNHESSTYAPMLEKSICWIDFTKSAQEVHNHIRGLFPWPVAVTRLGKKRVKVCNSLLSDRTGTCAGEVVENKEQLLVCCGDNRCIALTKVKPDGGKLMDISAFLRGNAIELGTIVGNHE